MGPGLFLEPGNGGIGYEFLPCDECDVSITKQDMRLCLQSVGTDFAVTESDVFRTDPREIAGGFGHEDNIRRLRNFVDSNADAGVGLEEFVHSIVEVKNVGIPTFDRAG